MIDISLLRVLKTREAFDKIYSNIPVRSLEQRTQIIVKDIAKYYKQFSESNTVDYVTFKDMFFNHWHRGLDKESTEFYNKILDHADKQHDEVSQSVVVNALLELALADNVMHLIEDYNAGDEIDVISELETLVTSAKDARKRKVAVDDTPFNLDELFAEKPEGERGLIWRNPELARALNPASFCDDFTIVAARPNQGKTTFILNEVTHWASQMDDRPILWCNNEGSRERIVKRGIQVALGATMSELVGLQSRSTLLDAYEMAIGAPHDRIQVKNIHEYWSWQVEELIDALRPKVVVFDMIDHIHFAGLKDARTDQILEEMYKWARNLGVKYNLLPIATSQISNEGAGLPYPAQGMLKDSKTGKQGAADNIIMLGHSDDDERIRSRFVSAPKTKSNAEGQSPPRAEFIFDIDRGRFNN